MIILASVFFAVFFNMTNLDKSFGLNFKPFNCVPCLSVWSAIVLYAMPVQIVDFVLIAFGSGVIGGISYKLMLKI